MVVLKVQHLKLFVCLFVCCCFARGLPAFKSFVRRAIEHIVSLKAVKGLGIMSLKVVLAMGKWEDAFEVSKAKKTLLS